MQAQRAPRLPFAAPEAPMKRVLVVDDDPQILSLTTRYLRGAGYEVLATDDFADARMQIHVSKPSVIVADVRLGLFNGIQLGILARELHRDVGVVIISGFDDVVLRRDTEQLGALFVSKPFGPADLLTAVERAGNAARYVDAQ
jgi:DNA-binding NtrC family response regulator